MTPEGPTWRGRLLRGLWRFLGPLALGVVFTSSTALALLTHSDLPVVRAAAAAVGNWLLEDVFYGRLTLSTPSRLSLRQLHLERVLVTDEQENTIIELGDVRIELATWYNLGRWLAADDKLTIALPHARIERAHVELVRDSATGEPTLVRALTPRPSPPRPATAPRARRDVRVFFPVLELGHVTARAAEFSELEPTLRNVHSQLLITGKGVALDVDRLGANVKGVLGNELAGTGSLKLRAPGQTEAAFVGFLGDMELQASATIEGTQVAIDAFSQAARPAAMKRIVPAWPFQEPVSARVHAEGQLPELALDAQFSTEESSLELDGRLDLADPVEGHFDVALKKLDVRALVPSFPETHIDARATVDFATTSDPAHPVDARLHAETEATVIEGHDVPPLVLDLRYDAGLVQGDLQIREPGLPVNAEVSVRDERHATAEFNVPPFALERSRRVPRGPRGLVSLDGTLVLDGDSLEARVRGRAERLRYRDFSAERIDFEGTGSASTSQLDEPKLSAELTLRGARYGVVRYDHVRVSAQGSRHRVHAKADLRDADGRSLSAAGWVDAHGRVQDVTLTAKRHGVVIRAVVDHADPAIPAIELRRLELEDDAARLEGKLRYRPGLLEGELSAENVDLARVAAAFGVSRAEFRGTLDSESSFALGRDLSRARLVVGLKNGAFDNWGRLHLRLDATLDGQAIDGSLVGSDETSGVQVSATFDTKLGGHALQLDSYTGATGSAEVALSNVTLTGVDLLLEDDRLSDVEGLLGLRARLQRDKPTGWPTALVELGAQDLGARVKVGQEWREARGFAAYTSAMFNAEEKRVFGSGMLGDGSGPLVTLTGALDFDPDAFLADARAAMRKFQEQPINLVLGVPRRRFDGFPLLEPSDVPNGALEGQLTLYGTPKSPRLSALVNLHDVSPREDPSRPVSLKVSAQYAPGPGDLEAVLEGVLEGRNAMLGKIEGTVPVSALFGVARWSADARVAFDRFPLDLIPPVAAAEVKGNATGTLELSREGRAGLSAQFEVEDVTVGRAPLGNGTLAVKGSPGEALLSFTLADVQRSLNIKALALGSDPEQLPLPHQIKSVGVSLQGRHVDAALLGPTLRNVVARLEGDLDADLTWFTEKLDDGTWSSRLEGSAELTRGGAYVDALGLQLHDVRAALSARPEAERTLIQIRHVTAKARTNQVNFEGSGQLYLEGATVMAGDAELLLRSVPITLDGLSLGKASGRARCTLERAAPWDVEGPHLGKDYLVVNLDLEHWNMKAARSAGRRLIDLSGNPDVVVLQAEAPPDSRPDLTPYRIFLRLREGARFGFGDINLPLSGEIQADYDGKSRVSGELRIEPGSRLPILGKRFDVLAGAVRLDPKNLGNPELDFALSATTPEGNLVNLTVAGTVQEPILDPPASELQALFGGGTATVLGGGVQALGFNELLGESVGNVELRVDAGEQEDDPSYAAAVQIGPNLWFEGGYQRAQNSGLNQNQTDVFSGTVDYRFRESWSLKSRMGNAGGGVDVLWQHRY